MSFRSFIYSSKIENHRKLAAESLSKGDVASAIYNFREALKCDYTEEIYHDVLLAYAEGKLFNNGFVEAVIMTYDKHHKGASWIAKHQDRSFIIWKSTCKRLYDEGCKLLDENKYEEAEWILYKASLLTDLSAYSLFVRNVLNGNFRKYKIERIDEDMPTEWYGFKGKLDYYKANEYFEWYKKMSVQSDEIEALKSLLLTAKEYAESAKNKSGLKSVPIFHLLIQKSLLVTDTEASLSVALLNNINGEIENFQKREEGERVILREMIKKAEQGDVNAQWKLGWKYYDGDGVRNDYTKAFSYFKLVADAGYVDAQYVLGLLYEDGIGVEKDYTLAAHFYQLAAEQGSADAQNSIGLLYHKGQGVEQNYRLAAHYYELAAKQDNMYAQDNLGRLYEDGLGVDQDYTLAAHYYKLAAEQGDAKAQNSLGLLYKEGLGVERDYGLAAYYFKLSAEQENLNGQYNLGRLYEDGLGVEQDFTLAVHYYRLVAEQGNKIAQFKLGLLYENGQGVEQDYTLAEYYYKLSAEQGYASAQYNIGLLYQTKMNVNDSYSLAAHYYKLAVKQNHSSAQLNLGIMYSKGLGVEKDYEKAMYYISLAIKQGNVNAQYNLGVMYYLGEGVEKDDNKAIQWFMIAARNGNQNALHNLKIIKRKMKEDSWRYYFKSLARQMVGTIASEAVSVEIEERIDGDWGEILGDAAGDIVNEMITKENKESKDLNML